MTENKSVKYNKSEREKLLGIPLTFEITGDGNILWGKTLPSTSIERVIQYSKNGDEWVSITANTTGGTAIPVVSGDTIQFKGDNPYYHLSSEMGNTFSGSTAQFKIKGNIMSLISSTNFSTLTTLTESYNFKRLFQGCTGLTDANKLILPVTTLTWGCYMGMFQGCTSLTVTPGLPATTLEQNCYSYMFQGCTSLTAAPELPATTLAEDCYSYMFQGCTSLTTVPGLPATTLVDYCYSYMFQGCTSLTAAPELPATTLAGHCYYNMFKGCTNLTTAPELSATTLAESCYSSMFNGCTNLTTAPELPATTLVNYCYYAMFSDCYKLNYIKCLAIDISANSCTTRWVYNVQKKSGTFIKNPSMSSWTTDNNGIPANWTVVDAS